MPDILYEYCPDRKLYIALYGAPKLPGWAETPWFQFRPANVRDMEPEAQICRVIDYVIPEGRRVGYIIRQSATSWLYKKNVHDDWKHAYRRRVAVNEMYIDFLMKWFCEV
jgi:hypothetical protein